MVTQPVVCLRHVGREPELTELALRYDALVHGRGSMVLVSGSAGIGKSRLLAEFERFVRDRGGRFAGGQCFEHARLPLGPLLQILDALHERESDAIERAADRQDQFARTLRTMRRALEAEPAVIAFEDAHWADPATVDFLWYLAANLNSVAALVIVSFRNDHIHLSHPLAPVLPKLERLPNVSQLRLAPLTATEMVVFAQSALGGQRLPDALIDEALALAEGNPLFAEELLRQAIDNDAGGVPDSLRSVILARAEVLDPHERLMLACAAAIGREYDAHMLAELTGRPLQDVAAILRRARELQFISELHTNPPRYRFRHALIRQALSETLLTIEMRPLHERIASAFERLPLDDDNTVALAHHWWMAGDSEKAARFGERAGDFAHGRFAFRDAITYYERALESIRPADDRKRAELYEKLATCLRYVRDVPQTPRLLRAAIAFYASSGENERVSQLAGQLAVEESVRGDRVGAGRWYRAALEALEDQPEHPLLFRAFVGLSRYHGLGADFALARRYLAAAQGFAGWCSAGDLVSFYSYQGMIFARLGRRDEAYASVRAAIALCDETDDLQAPIYCYGSLGYAATVFGDLETAVEAFTQARSVAVDRFVLTDGAYWVAAMSVVLTLAGKLEEARKALEEADAWLNGESAPIRRFHLVSGGIRLGLLTGDDQLVDRFADAAVVESVFAMGEAQRINPIVGAFAELYGSRGDPERAAALVARSIEPLESANMITIDALPGAALYAAPADLIRLRALLAKQPIKGELTSAFDALLAAQLAGARGEDPRGAAELAARGFRKLGFAPFEALAFELARRPADALTVYARIGATGPAARLEAVMNQRNRQGRAAAGLTRREREIFDLIKAGRSNSEIAARLSISPRTVETHVGSIFNKCNVTSRAELFAKILREVRVGPT